MKEKILAVLETIEQQKNVRILYACEAGSRAWGFHSIDSDYDVRFIYVRTMDWYLSIDVENRSDVIERPIVDELDINGWDLRKALQLLRKSNPPLLEWLNSSIVYREDDAFMPAFRELMPSAYSPRSCAFHYLQMAKNNYRSYLQGDVVPLKKYLYVLRPLVAIRWILQQRRSGETAGGVPVDLATLLDAVYVHPVIRSEIDQLVERKRSGTELGVGSRNPVLHAFIDDEIAWLEGHIPTLPVNKVTSETLDRYFRTAAIAASGGIRAMESLFI